MSRYTILTAQLEADDDAVRAQRRRFADKAARFALGSDDFCRKPHEVPRTGLRKAAPKAETPSWRTAVKQWHKGPPPHEGVWEVRSQCAQIAAASFSCYRYGQWSIHVSTTRCASGVHTPTGFADTEWHGYAPDAEGWIKVDPADWKGSEPEDGPIHQLGDQKVEVWWREGGHRYPYPANCIHGWNTGAILAYRLLP